MNESEFIAYSMHLNENHMSFTEQENIGKSAGAMELRMEKRFSNWRTTSIEKNLQEAVHNNGNHFFTSYVMFHSADPALGNELISCAEQVV